MLRLSQPQRSLWDSVLPPELLELSGELKKVDDLLDDETFLAPFREKFRARRGRPTIPMDTFLRLMYLKFRYQLGYETLVCEVADSLKWRRFCRLSVDEPVPHATTLIKLNQRLGTGVVEDLSETAVQKARERKLVRGRKLRVDTTVVPAHIAYPTDAGLLACGVRVLSRLVGRVQGKGLAVRTRFRDRQRSVRKRLLLISKVLRGRGEKVRAQVRQVTREIACIVQAAVDEGQRVLANARRALAGSPQRAAAAKRATEQLATFLARTRRVLEQTWQVEAGKRSIPDRLVSLFDPRARPIQTGKRKRPTEFGRKLLLQETDGGLISGYEVLAGNPADVTLLVGAVDRHTEAFGRVPEAVATDRGFASAANEARLQARGVKRISLPRRGKLGPQRRAYERQAWFRRLQRWRAGQEGRISLLKRKYGLAATLAQVGEGPESWIGWGIWAHNLNWMAARI